MTMAAVIESRTAEAPAWSRASHIAGVEILSDLSHAETIWRGLESQQQFSTPYQRFDFLSPWQRQVGERESLLPFIVIAYDAERRPLLLLPLALMPERERQQQQRPAFGVISDNDERQKALALSDLPLPRAKEIEPLIRRGELLLAFETAPDRLRVAEIAENIDVGDAARSRPRRCFRRSAFDHGSHGHCETCLQGIIYIFRLWPTFAKKCQQRVM